jgi:hypothetical protein
LESGLLRRLGACERFAVAVACLCHDLQHPVRAGAIGVNGLETRV